ncbi:MAG: HEAT repeat domain-containing protein [Saprospiraceae bacterium]|nr:HEAT repeat domain-containing protein [Saprospiraceae bacterium]
MQILPILSTVKFLSGTRRLSGYFCFLKFAFVILTAVLFQGELFSQQSINLPSAKLPRHSTIDIQHIELDLQFDWTKKRVSGTATITLRPLTTTRQITLDAGFLQIHRVEKLHPPGVSEVLQFTCDSTDLNDNLRIALQQACMPGEIIQLQIRYHSDYHNDTDPNNLWGSFGRGLRFFAPTTTEPRRRRQLWSMGAPHGNRYWFPGWDDPADLRTFELRATVEKPLQVISNGKLLSITPAPNDAQTFHWKMEKPHANHQTTLVVGEYLDTEQSANGIRLHSLGYPDELEATRASVVRLPDMFRFFSELTGVPYPYDAYYQIFVQEYPWGGGSGAGISTISENMIDDFGTHADFFYLWDGVEAQDLAAQWYGNLLTPANWSDAWLKYSFALYMDCLYTEHKNGHDEMLLWNRNFQHNTYHADWQAGIRRPIVTRHYDDPSAMCFDNYPLRGALVLHLLRKHLGEEKWLKTIRLYTSQYAGKTVTTADFIQVVEQVAKEPMAWFFDQWLFKTGHPVFDVSQQYDTSKKQLTLTVKQLQKTDSLSPFPQTAFFQGKVEVEIDGRIEQVWLKPQAENVYSWNCPKAPQLVNFDVENTWIRELTFEKTTAQWLYQLKHSRDIVARRTAMQQLAGIYSNEKTADTEKPVIVSAFRELIESNAYWRLRYITLLTLQGLVGNQTLDAVTENMLLQLIRREKSWNRAAAIAFLGKSKNPKHADLFVQYLYDESDRVVNSAAVALGQTKAETAFETLVKLKDKPSWKNQSLISALNGLRELGDPRGAGLALEALKDENAAARWTLATSTWDFRLAAAETLVALNQSGAGYEVVYQRFIKSLKENNPNDIFNNVLLMVTLGDARAKSIFPMLKERFTDHPQAMQAIESFENQLLESLK